MLLSLRESSFLGSLENREPRSHKHDGKTNFCFHVFVSLLLLTGDLACTHLT